ncbi:MAG: TRAP transporter substrate-binding protein [Alphaproteobacteria bacterium]
MTKTALSKTASSKTNRRKLLKGAGLSAGLGVGIGLAAGTLPTPAISQGLKSWTVVSAFTGSGILGRGLARFCERVTRATNDQFQFEIYNVNEREPAFKVLNAVTTGRANMGYGAPYYWFLESPALQFLASMPFGLTAQEQNAWFFHGQGIEQADKIYNSLGAKFLPLGNTGNQMGGWFNTLISEVSDFDRLKFRMPGLGGNVLKSFGTRIANLSGSQVIPALKSNQIDGTEWIGPAADLDKQLHLYAAYYYYPGWHEPGTVLDLSINLNDWTGLTSEQRAVFNQVAAAINAEILTEFHHANAKAMEILLEEHNVELKRFPDHVLKSLGQRSGEVLFDLASKDADSRRLFVDLGRFRSQTKRFSHVTDGEFLASRELNFSFPE